MSATVASDDAPPRLSRWSGIIPAVRWLRDYKPAWFRADLVAGITLAAYLLPAGLGDASLANLPPQAGLYACLFGGLVFWLFCSSRHTVITLSEMKFTIEPALTSQATKAMSATSTAVPAASALNRVVSPPAIPPNEAPTSSEMADVTVMAVCRELQKSQKTSPPNKHA